MSTHKCRLASTTGFVNRRLLYTICQCSVKRQHILLSECFYFGFIYVSSIVLSKESCPRGIFVTIRILFMSLTQYHYHSNTSHAPRSISSQFKYESCLSVNIVTIWIPDMPLGHYRHNLNTSHASRSISSQFEYQSRPRSISSQFEYQSCPSVNIVTI